ncbi:uncharacterized protein KGF55_003898 [Candida pseudojiufengensis]|uniref:uncharacterized protein n=1 Tax=Candida pseudojiufengensis TaxID=497109 RepID=UPI0022244F7C|nr:uncharacterized protein KGF55_003898 [Candida pseudojiufengensis]KAI5961581.1 hypothetical protein KGF55_003898 [Candida pseudojiufengensis]
MSSTSNFVKKLASNDKATRDSALESLKRYLHSKTSSKSNSLTLLDMEKLWKGLYYSMWFCDRAKAQERLAENLGQLYSNSVKSNESFILFAKAFNLIIIKEWPSIDQWRIDKYYLLIRRILRHNFKYLKQQEWESNLVEQWVSMMEETILSGESNVPLALPYHLCDIYLDELELIMFEELEEEELDKSASDYLEKYQNLISQKVEIVDEIPVLKLIQPFANLNKDAKLKTLREKCKEDVLDDERLVDWAVVESDDEDSNDEAYDKNDDEVEEDEEEEWKGFQ